MKVYRISKNQFINDLSGYGAAHYPGRWNSKGVFVLYTAATAALALLESVVHMDKLLRTGYSLATIVLPEASINKLEVHDLPAGWDGFPPHEKLKKFGDLFVQASEYLALQIPSSIMPEDYNFLINPLHQQFNKVKIESVRELKIDSRL